MSKYLRLKETGVSYKLAFFSEDISVQNSVRKNKKLSKVRQDRKTLTSVFVYFLSASAKNLFLLG